MQAMSELGPVRNWTSRRGHLSVYHSMLVCNDDRFETIIPVRREGDDDDGRNKQAIRLVRALQYGFDNNSFRIKV